MVADDASLTREEEQPASRQQDVDNDHIDGSHIESFARLKCDPNDPRFGSTSLPVMRWTGIGSHKRCVMTK